MLSFNPEKSHYFYVGVAGSGMSALAQYQVMAGGTVSGSDRDWNPDDPGHRYDLYRKMGINFFPQDGSGLERSITAVVKSTAIENSNPDLKAAEALKIPVLHRSEVLANWVNTKKCIAVAGTSGKSTVTAMIFDLLEGVSASPSVITGGDLESLKRKHLPGNAFAGNSDLLVVEADESDGTLVEYHPHVGLLLNIEKDHKEISDLLPLFEKFMKQSSLRVVNADDSRIAGIVPRSASFGESESAKYRITDIRLSPRSGSFKLNGVDFTVPWPGKYSIINASAALSVCAELGFKLEDLRKPLSVFAGVGRRFQSCGVKRGVEVIDDYAHNPAKLEAAIKAAQSCSKRVIAVFQPHGYGPARFMRHDYVASFVNAMNENDILYMPEIFYAGGSVVKDISSADIVADIKTKGRDSRFVANRSDLPALIAKEAKEGDIVMVMGARDSSLTTLAKSIAAAL
ncbi:MAG: UDP-N-acetylmuramate--alanine ligase [Fibrobacteres bacterium]|nr:UDP-N-acetylmuramate--alanine ligase [Fibrobacterota bacterium]